MAREIKKILVIKLSALGDFVLALAAMKRIREAHKRAHITLLTTPQFEGLAKSSPYFNAVETDGKPSGPGAWLALRTRIKKAKYDRVYDLQTSSASNRIFQMLRPFPPEWSGIALGCALPHKNPHRNSMHTLERQADQLKYAGIYPDAPTEPGSAPPPDLSWVLRKAPQERPVAGGVMPRPYVLFIPGGSAHRLDKRWPVDRYGELGKILYNRGFDIVILGGPQESAEARQIQRYVGKARDLTGRTDFARIAILGAKAALVVGNDTGPLHLAAATGAPTIVLFSRASDPSLSAPRGHVAVLQADNLGDLAVASVAQAANALAPAPGGA
ncbi:MAG: glycosyltransferase family 9 protein [Phenylobacterium sp.]|jgi:ADP-heptose:LPS heptosyltransferase|uniref:glycosyltransferase family 9 protein n=1 Tax=Phenylobacterium sp. TaxID=1871053 RepID=UPI001B510AB3|nr:glycosyltransferase family 9 protein [Phenylobacterium sp.]MBP7651049.1 glycosyltransferase family 9 protein [Phenylobacterium sp.]MBP7817160.1 glycosyltransferase family 9 protein [Phenylobacterium sp.]MBP9230566.1 glycosyltransferase family 9 protein [Phenylobacterium sp.]